MVPQKAKEEWAITPEAVRTWVRRGAYVGGLLLTLVTGGAISGAVQPQAPDLSEQVQTNTRNIAKNTAQIDSIRAERKEDRTVLDFLSCGQESRINGVSETPCLRYLTGRAQ